MRNHKNPNKAKIEETERETNLFLESASESEVSVDLAEISERSSRRRPRRGVGGGRRGLRRVRRRVGRVVVLIGVRVFEMSAIVGVCVGLGSASGGQFGDLVVLH